MLLSDKLYQENHSNALSTNSLTLDRNNLQEWVPTTVSPLILFWTKDAWTRANGDPSYSINQLLSPLLGLEPLIGLLEIVVWRDIVIATPFPVQY